MSRIDLTKKTLVKNSLIFLKQNFREESFSGIELNHKISGGRVVFFLG